MAAGFVYILLNVSFPELIKIGRTSSSVSERAKRISGATGVPTPFIVVYDEFVDDCEAVERSLHQRFGACRVNERREFFRVPVREAIRVLKNEADSRRPQAMSRDEWEILPDLLGVYGALLHEDLTSVKIVNLPAVCYLETTRKRAWRDEIVERIDLSFISDGIDDDDGIFRPSNGARVNANLFLELDSYSLIMCTDLFTSAGADEIAQAYEPTHPRDGSACD
jgi:hypothetical protein